MTYSAVFMGTPQFGVTIVDALFSIEEVELKFVVCGPDRPAGRGRKRTSPPVKTWALDHGVPVIQIESLRSSILQNVFTSQRIDIVVVASFGFIVPRVLLDWPTYGALNVHASLLPRHRGASPIPFSILAGDAETGITLMRMTIELDAGPVYAQEKIPISDDDTAETLEKKLADLGARLLKETLLDILEGQIRPRPQDENNVTFAPKMTKEMGWIPWHKSAQYIERHIRAMTPWPTPMTQWNGQVLKIWKARCVHGLHSKKHARPGETVSVSSKEWIVQTGEGLLSLEEVQLPGKKKMPVSAFLAGHTVKVGDIFDLPYVLRSG